MWDSNEAVKNSGPLVFSTGFSTEGTGRTIAKFAVEHLKVKRLALVANTNPWSTIVAPAFKKTFTDAGGQIPYEVTTEVEDRDFRTIAARIKNANVDAIFFPFALPSTAAEFVKQVRSSGYSGYLLSPETFSGDAIPLAGPAAEGVYLSWIYTDSVPLLLDAYTKEFGIPSPQPEIVAMGAEAMWTVQRTCKLANDTATEIREAMKKMFGPDRGLAKTMRIFKVHNGRPVAVE